MRIEFDIDELLLVGFDSRDRHRIADAVERALAARVTAADVLPLTRAGHGEPVLRAAKCEPSTGTVGTSPSAIAVSVSRSIVSALAGQRGQRQAVRMSDSDGARRSSP